MRARISIIGSDILCECTDLESLDDTRIPLTDDALTELSDWTQHYKRAVRINDPSLLLGLGRAIFDWLNESTWASTWVRSTGDRILEIAVDEAASDAAAALLDLPWEVLAHEGDFLAADPAQRFVVFRSIGRGRGATPAPPAYRDLGLMFMAASPKGQRELDFEAQIRELQERIRKETG